MSPLTRAATDVEDFILLRRSLDPASPKNGISPAAKATRGSTRNQLDPGQPSTGSDALPSRFYASAKFTQILAWERSSQSHQACGVPILRDCSGLSSRGHNVCPLPQVST